MNNPQWTDRNGRSAHFDLVGYLPDMLDLDNPQSAREQLDANYAHGGGWRPFEGFDMNPEDHSITYPGDPTFKPLAWTILRAERIYFYEHAWVAIVQPDESCEISRMD